MQIIPVVDILSGQVVHARSGNRALYSPVQSCLTKSAAPADIVAAFLDLYPFQRIYIADLDAIQQQGDSQTSISPILKAYPNIEFWIDCGLNRNNRFHHYTLSNNSIPVYGTENKLGLQNYKRLLTTHPDLILSLDFSRSDTEENINIINAPEFLPNNIIGMTLYKVGSDTGPDFSLLKQLLSLMQGKTLFAAGGIRHAQDVMKLKSMGIKGVLVASALHGGQLNHQALNDLSQ